ncbi:hypothetical protein [Blastopirellula marina]|uniref:Uncharacterized protein n=1 Tax=Blastopirellula marina TaxID=124 RepID=A0A2S8GP20_9BACT|nr:hypothetical protein [Blastopirellula marina]PQO46196.1 hypothetical protein C5Y93_09415 [Blastopirellula marina]
MLLLMTTALAFFGGTLLGLIAIGIALLKYLRVSRIVGWLCVGLGAYAVIGMASTILLVRRGWSDDFTVSARSIIFLFLMSAPSLLGGITLWIGQLYQGQEAEEHGRYSLVFLFYVVTVIAVLLGSIPLFQRYY